VACIAASLLSPHGCPLRKLWLVNCDMRDVGCRSLAAALFCSDAIEELNISDNDLMGADSILRRSLTVNTSLRTLLYRNCGLVEGASLRPISSVERRELSWSEKKLASHIAAEERTWLLDLIRGRDMAFPKPPRANKRIKKRRRLPAKGLVDVEPAWKRGALVDSWAQDDLEQLVQEPGTPSLSPPLFCAHLPATTTLAHLRPRFRLLLQCRLASPSKFWTSSTAIFAAR
jgi:hypothetical protein